MSNQHNHTDMIDAYLTGQLNQEDSARLMERLEQDPALKEEFLLQQDIVHSLQAKRRSELKARLDNVNVGSGPSYPLGGTALKMVASTAIIALIGAGIYFSYNTSDVPERETVKPVEISHQAYENNAGSEIPAQPAVKSKAGEITPAEKMKPEIVEESKRPGTSNSVPSVLPQENIQDMPVEEVTSKAGPAEEVAEVTKPDVISFFDEQDPSSNTPEADAPQDKLSALRNFSTQNIEVTTVSDKKYPFHYMFFNNQLHIYGEFSKVPYEVLEVNTGTYTRYFLFHDSLYYELNPDQRHPTRLKELKSEAMIQELEITRNQKLKR